MHGRHTVPGRMPKHKAGQAIIESCLVIGLICLIFMAALQVVDLTVSREIMDYSAACSARAKTVGFNAWMVQKVGRVACIPNAGAMTEPADWTPDTTLPQWLQTLRPGALWTRTLQSSPTDPQSEVERVRIPEYLGSENILQAEFILNYENWDTISVHAQDHAVVIDGNATADTTVRVTADQDYLLWVPLHRTFYAGDHVPLSGNSEIANHYPLYLDDQNW